MAGGKDPSPHKFLIYRYLEDDTAPNGFLDVCRKWNSTDGCSRASCPRAHACCRCGELGHKIQHCKRDSPVDPTPAQRFGPELDLVGRRTVASRP